MQFTIYRLDTGAIVKFGDCLEEDILLQATEEEGIFPGEQVNDEIWYFVGGNPEPRPALGFNAEYVIAANGVAAVTLPLPAGSAIYHDATGESWLDEDELHVTSDSPGTFVYRIEPPFPWRGPFEVTIHAA